jgi:protein-S-isoprenylcysteine O-methyltransferase Ste14
VTLTTLGNAVCWGLVVAVWIVAAGWNVRHAPPRRRRAPISPRSLAAVVVFALAVVAAHQPLHDLVVRAEWVHALGLAILAASAAFTLWSRFALGAMWSFDPIVKHGHELRTSGPYAVTRHPIYTGLLGMLLGSTLLDGVGRWIVLVPIGLVVLWVKLRQEEQLLVAEFPDAYPAYRRHVPGLVPRPRRRRATSARASPTS